MGGGGGGGGVDPSGPRPITTVMPRQNCRHFVDDILKCIFANENIWILIKISLKFVTKFQINNNATISKTLKCFSSRLAVVFAQSIEVRFYVENEDVVGAGPTGDAHTPSECLTILLPIKVWLISEVWRYVMLHAISCCIWPWFIESLVQQTFYRIMKATP